MQCEIQLLTKQLELLRVQQQQDSGSSISESPVDGNRVNEPRMQTVRTSLNQRIDNMQRERSSEARGSEILRQESETLQQPSLAQVPNGSQGHSIKAIGELLSEFSGEFGCNYELWE